MRGSDIRRGKIGGQVQLQGQLGGRGSGWEEVCRLVDVTAGSPVTREGGEANADTHTIFSTWTNLVPSEGDTGPAWYPVPKILLRIESADGNDTGAAKMEQVVVAGQPVTVSGSVIIVSAQIFLDELGVLQAPPAVSCKVSVFISVGHGEDVQPSRWRLPGTPLQAFEQVTTSRCRLREWMGFNNGAIGTQTYLMLFDWPGGDIGFVPNGTAPVLTMRIPGGANWSDDFIESVRSFSWGLAWACSSTPDVLTLDATQSMRVDIELYAELDFTGTN